jgi:ATP-dependent helicase/nuclease subunit A
MMNYTPEQQQAIETIGCHVCVVAGAGTGKTHVLVDRILRLLENETATLDEIVAITFTRKAASEMRSRLREACRKRANPDDAAAMTFWRTTEQQVETARITTIDSFCAGLLREQAGRLGLDPDFTLLTESETALMRENAVTTTLLDLMEHDDGPIHVLVAEFGLFAVQNAMRDTLGKNVLPTSTQSGDEFNAEATTEALLARAAQCMLPYIERMRDTLEAFADQGQTVTDKREVLRRLQVTACDAILDDAPPSEKHAAVATAIKASSMGTRSNNWPASIDLESLKEIQKEAKKLLELWQGLQTNRLAQIESTTLTHAFAEVFDAVEKTYTSQKAARSAMDFSDLLNGANAMFNDYPHLRKIVAGQIRYLLIDEFQDTNDAQWNLTRHLMKTDDQPGAELFIVGDAKQSIYRFRQADVRVFRNAQESLDEVIRLGDSFRTLPDVMHFINYFFEKAGLLSGVEPDYHPLNPRRDPLDQPQIECWIPPELNPPEKENADDIRKREAHLMAHRIRTLCDPDSNLLTHATGNDELPRPMEYGDIAILFRTKSNFLLYEGILREYGIPTRILSGSGFYKQQEIIDIRNLLHVVHNPWNETALLALLRSPVVGLDDNSIYFLNKHQSLVQAWHNDTALENSKQHERLQRSRALVADLRSKRDWPLPAFLRYVLSETYLEAVLLSLHHGIQKAGNVRRLIEMAQELSHIDPVSISTFIHHLDQLAAQDVREAEATLHASDGGAVSIMSIHASKGLEYPVVILADTTFGPKNGGGGDSIDYHPACGASVAILGEDGHRQASPVGKVIRILNQEEEKAENSRTLYVALTRAQDRLIISGGPNPEKSSWLTAINNHLSVVDRDDGDCIQGDGWACTLYRHADPPPTAARESRDTESETLDPAALTKRAEPVSSRRGDTAASVTEFIRRQSESPSEKSSSTPGQRNALLRGTILHRLLELWDFTNDAHPNVTTLLQKEFPAATVDADQVSDFDAVLQRFAESQLHTKLKESPQIKKELPFTLNLDSGTLTGTIDALLPDGTIIDYKTGHPTADLKEKYRRQLCIYAAAVEKLSGTRPPSGLLYYLDTGESTEIYFTNEDLQTYLHPQQ